MLINTIYYVYNLKTNFLSPGIYFKLKIEISGDYKFLYNRYKRSRYNIRYYFFLCLIYYHLLLFLSPLSSLHIFHSCHRFPLNLGSNVSSIRVRLHKPSHHTSIYDIIICIPKSTVFILYSQRVSHVRCLFRSSLDNK